MPLIVQIQLYSQRQIEHSKSDSSIVIYSRSLFCLYYFNSSARTGGATELIFSSNAFIFSVFTEGHTKKSHIEPTWDGP